MAEIRVRDAMSEADLQAAVLAMCRWMGLLVYHTHDSRRSQPGYPDLTIAGPGGVIFRELKTARGRVSDAQKRWLQVLGAGHADAAVWRPADLAEGVIRTELEKLR